MTFVAIVLGLAGFTFVAGQDAGAAARPQSCVVQEIPSLQHLDAVRRLFAQRAVEIIRASARSDRRALAILVSPTAEFTLWNGDAGLGQLTGVDGAIEFAENMRATHFQFSVPFAGPLSTYPCGHQRAQVTFANASGDRAIIVEFRFEHGLLVQAEGHLGALTEGELSTDDSNG